MGAVRFTATGNTAGIDWSKTSGLLLDGSTLYVGSSVTGNLASVGWNDGVLSGTATNVSGPAIDGYDWRARASFIEAG